MTGLAASVGFTCERSIDGAAGRHGIDADDRIPRGDFLVREIDAAVPMEHGLIPVRRPRERHILLSAGGLARIPREDDAVIELVHEPAAVHPLFQERGDEGNSAGNPGADLLQVHEAAEPEVAVSAAEADEPRRRDRHRVPGPAGERELHLRQPDLVRLQHRSRRRVPLQRQILRHEAARRRREPDGAPVEVEQVVRDDAGVELEVNDVAECPDGADLPARHLFHVSAAARGVGVGVHPFLRDDGSRGGERHGQATEPADPGSRRHAGRPRTPTLAQSPGVIAS
jgi:hypothetical protein